MMSRSVLAAAVAALMSAACADAPRHQVIMNGEGVIQDAKPAVDRAARQVAKIIGTSECRFERIDDWRQHDVQGVTAWTPVKSVWTGACGPSGI